MTGRACGRFPLFPIASQKAGTAHFHLGGELGPAHIAKYTHTLSTLYTMPAPRRTKLHLDDTACRFREPRFICIHIYSF